MGIKDFFVRKPSDKLARLSTVHSFSQPIGSDYETWQALVGLFAGSTVSRATSMKVPAVKRARDVLCSLGSLPLHTYDGSGNKVDRALFYQPERFQGITRNVSIANLIDDLFFYGQALWRVVDRDYTSYPTAVERVPYGRYDIDPDTGTVTMDGTKLNSLDVCLFRSQNDSLLQTGASTINALIALEASAALYINSPRAAEYWRSTIGQDLPDDEVTAFLTAVSDARKKGAVGWIPDGVERLPVEKGVSAEDIQLSSAREFGILEVSRLTGLPPNWLGVPVQTLTYQNAQDERKAILDFTAAPYLSSIELRCSLPDITPRTQFVRFNYDAFLRQSTEARYASYATALNGPQPWMTVDQVRALENWGPMNEAGAPNG